MEIFIPEFESICQAPLPKPARIGCSSLQDVYIDKLDGKIGADYYKRASSQWQDEIRRCYDELRRYQDASEAYMNEGVDLLILARDAEQIFHKHQGISRKRLLNFVLSNCTWKDAQLTANFRKPFDLLLECVTPQTSPKSGNGYYDAGKENWLRFAREFRTLCLAPDRALKEKLEAIRHDEFGWLRRTGT